MMVSACPSGVEQAHQRVDLRRARRLLGNGHALPLTSSLALPTHQAIRRRAAVAEVAGGQLALRRLDRALQLVAVRDRARGRSAERVWHYKPTFQLRSK